VRPRSHRARGKKKEKKQASSEKLREHHFDVLQRRLKGRKKTAGFYRD